jgi:hypothetical protein
MLRRLGLQQITPPAPLERPDHVADAIGPTASATSTPNYCKAASMLLLLCRVPGFREGLEQLLCAFGLDWPLQQLLHGQAQLLGQGGNLS